MTIGWSLAKLFGFPIFQFWASPDEGYSRNVSCALNLISTFFLEYSMGIRNPSGDIKIYGLSSKCSPHFSLIQNPIGIRQNIMFDSLNYEKKNVHVKNIFSPIHRRYNWSIVESGVKHHKTNQPIQSYYILNKRTNINVWTV